MSESFGEHESVKLQDQFSQRPFQMQEPGKTKIIFLGRDANFDKDIEQNDCFFNEILDYLKDGIGYWKKNKEDNIHTPMLKPYYKGAGKRYHQKFRKLGFTSDNAKDICFLELLNCCTYGYSSKNKGVFNKMVLDDKNKCHIELIKKLSKKKNVKICIPYGLITIIEKLKLFETKSENIIPHTHFSSSISNKDLESLKEELHKFLNGK